MPPLQNPSHEAFCWYYLQSGNGALSYEKAYPNCKRRKAVTKDKSKGGWTPYTESWRLLRYPQIKARLAELSEQRRKKFEITEDRWLRELAAIAFADPADFKGEDGTLLELKMLSAQARAAISRIETVEITAKTRAGQRKQVARETKYHLHDKVAALGLIGKCRSLGFLVEKHEYSGPGGGPIEISPVREAVKARAAGLLREAERVLSIPGSE